MITIDALKKFGADTDEGLERCFGNEEFYLKLVCAVPNEKSFDVLKEAIENNDLSAGFEAAHALKGVLSNLSLTALFNPTSEITENLRAHKEIDYKPLLDELLNKRNELKQLCEG